MGTESRTSDDKVRAAKKAALSNPRVDVGRIEKALNAVATLEGVGIRRRGYNLRAPTDRYHRRAEGEKGRTLDLTP